MKIEEQLKTLEEAFSRYKQLKKELEWWRTYGKYVAKVHNNVDAEACGFADGDNEYQDNFN